MTESIKKSLNNLTQTIKSNNNKNPQSSILSSYEFKPKKQIETLINTPINTLLNKSYQQDSLHKTISKSTSNTLQKTASFFSIKNILFIILLIFLLAFLGLNIFTYLSESTDYITKLFGPIFSTTGQVFGNTTKNVISYSSTGAQEIVKTGANTSENILDVAKNSAISSINFLQNQLKNNKSNSQVEPVRTESLPQGYCFIGKINDVRHCVKVNQNQKCISGDIYPTMDICVNPKLRG